MPAAASAAKMKLVRSLPSGAPGRHAPPSSWHGIHQPIVAVTATVSSGSSTPATTWRRSQALGAPVPSTTRTRGRKDPTVPNVWDADTVAACGSPATGVVVSVTPFPSKSHSASATPASAATYAVNVNGWAEKPSGAPATQPTSGTSRQGDHQPIVARAVTASRSTGTPPTSTRSQAPVRPPAPTARTCGAQTPADP